MRLDFQYKGQPQQLLAIHLCSHGEYGDYEVFPIESLDLDFSNLDQRLHQMNINILGKNQHCLFLQYSGVEITWFDSGRMILENIYHPTNENALQLALSVCKSLEAFSV